MCKYCDLVSGDEKWLESGYSMSLYIERHNNVYSLVASYSYGNIEIDIKYCPFCGRKLV